MISNLDYIVFKENTFDYCFNMLTVNYSIDIFSSFKNIYKLLKPGGKFVCVLPAEDNLLFFKKLFLKLNKLEHNKSFHPVIDIMSLGSLGQNSGFKKIVVDKTTLQLSLKSPSNIWFFLRSIGESNALIGRNKSYYGKLNYIQLNKEISKQNLNLYPIHINFFIGYKI